MTHNQTLSSILLSCGINLLQKLFFLFQVSAKIEHRTSCFYTNNCDNSKYKKSYIQSDFLLIFPSWYFFRKYLKI